jgi:hypothetical protein
LIDFKSIFDAGYELHKIQDIDLLLEQILFQARRVLAADAGSIYVKGGDKLFIRYAQNDTLQKSLAPGEKLVYSLFSMPVDTASIAGYSAFTSSVVNVPNVHNIPKETPYSFNGTFDEVTGYKTSAALAFPLVSSHHGVLGVIQVINKISVDGSVVSFSGEDENAVSYFAETAAAALQRASLTRDIILKMIKMAELRDPKETGLHVKRVASYSVEIYDRWAYLHNVPAAERESFRDIFKIGSMLHDVGKVAISDAILKKPGPLDTQEFDAMQNHTLQGARLFDKQFS